MSVLTKITAITIAAGLFAPVAFAESFNVKANVRADASANVKTVNSSATTSVRAEENAEVGEDASDDNAAATGTAVRAEHQSAVSAQVQALLDVASRSGGIGLEVREIAQAVASSSEEVEVAKKEVEDRPAWMEVLIGSDYKNLGKLRSELATTQSAISRLSAARDRSMDATVKATLDAQISAFSADASSTEAFVSEHEDSFSVFGWFFKLFSR